MPDVRWDEELLGIGLCQQLLDALRRCAPDRKASVPVMVREHHQESPLSLDEEGRRAVAETLARLRQPQADCTDTVEDLRPHHGNPPWNENQKTARSNAPKRRLNTTPSRRTERGW